MDKSIFEMKSDKTKSMSFEQLLEETPPLVLAQCNSSLKIRSGYTLDQISVPPEIRLHCDDGSCGKVMAFDCEENLFASEDTTNWQVRYYRCRHCKSLKVFALMFGFKGGDVLITKVGEMPAFGKPLPSRLVTLVRDERELLTNGYRCETQGLGIGALTYYRRIVEDYREKFILEAKRVAQTLGASEEILRKFDEAAKEHQFDKSIGLIKDAIPQRLLIHGQNPFQLLHSALSQDIHNATDAECLQIAASIRIVLTEFVELIAAALADSSDLKTAVGQLMRKRERKGN